jgi:D-threo-aldose 1-dehydrogenase
LATGAIEGARYNYGPAPRSIIERVRRIEAVCCEFDVPLQAAATQFVPAHPAVASLILGARSAEQMRQSAAWFERPIPAELWAALKAAKLLRDDAPTPTGFIN